MDSPCASRSSTAPILSTAANGTNNTRKVTMTNESNIAAAPLARQFSDDALQRPDLRTVNPRANDLVVLRGWLQSDLPVIAEASQDPYIPLITTIPRTYTPGEGHSWLRRQHDWAAEGRECPMAITAAATGDVVGMATIYGINWRHRRAAIGAWILQRYRRRGHTRAAIALLLDLARELGLVRLEALVETSNQPALASLSKLGFTREGTLRAYYRIGDAQRDMVMFAHLL
jgi:ribosomal-protein-alanine N-acetyltransferase